MLLDNRSVYLLARRIGRSNFKSFIKHIDIKPRFSHYGINVQVALKPTRKFKGTLTVLPG